jgi:hypothetical protein
MERSGTRQRRDVEAPRYFPLIDPTAGGRSVDKREDSSGRFGGLDTPLLRRAGIPVSSNAVRASEPDGVLS